MNCGRCGSTWLGQTTDDLDGVGPEHTQCMECGYTFYTEQQLRENEQKLASGDSK